MTKSKNNSVVRSDGTKRTQKKNKASSRTMAPSSVPIATSTKRKQFRPQIEGSGDSITVTHTEYLPPITNSTPNSLNVLAFRVHPANQQLFSWLSTIAPSFDEYHFDYLKISYNAVCPSTTPGEVILMYDPDVADTAPTTVVAMLNGQFSADFAAWRSCGVDFPEHVISVPERALNVTAPNKNIPTNLQLETAFSSGTLFIGTFSSAPLNTTFGRIALSYRVRLKNFNISSISHAPGSTLRSTTLAPYACAKNGMSSLDGASPFGTAFLYNQFPGIVKLGTGVPSSTNAYGSMHSSASSDYPHNPEIDSVNLPSHSIATHGNELFLFDTGTHNLRIRFTAAHDFTVDMQAAISDCLPLPGNWNGVQYASGGVDILSLVPRALTDPRSIVPDILELDIVVRVPEMIRNLYSAAVPNIPQGILNVPCATLQLNVANLVSALVGVEGMSGLVGWTIDYWYDVGNTFAFL